MLSGNVGEDSGEKFAFVKEVSLKASLHSERVPDRWPSVREGNRRWNTGTSYPDSSGGLIRFFIIKISTVLRKGERRRTFLKHTFLISSWFWATR